MPRGNGRRDVVCSKDLERYIIILLHHGGGLAESMTRLLTRDHSLDIVLEACHDGWQKGGWRSVAGDQAQALMQTQPPLPYRGCKVWIWLHQLLK